MGDQRAEQSEAATASAPAVYTGAEAIARAERILVGNSVTRDPAMAEGLALAGVRAASVEAGAVASPAGKFARGMVSCVHHVTAAPGRSGGGAFEFAATSAQQAVDDCLAAHLLSQRLGRPGLCSLAPKLADDLALVQLPVARDSAKRLADADSSQEPPADPDRIAELAREALAEAAACTGRPAAPIMADGDADADLVLVAAGDGAAAARVAVRALAEAGVPARAAIVRLVRPFPTELARKALAGARLIVAVCAPDEAVHGLLAAVRAAAGEKAEVRGVAAAGSSELIESLREVLPDCGVDVSQLTAPEDPPLAHRLVTAPDAPWGEETARRVLAQLAAIGTLRLGRRTRHHGGAAMLAWSGGGVADTAPDLLIAAHPGAIEAAGLALLRPRSVVVVLSGARSSDELVRDLSAEVRTALRDREHPLYWVAPVAGGEAPVPGAADRVAARMLAFAAFALMSRPEAPDEVAQLSSGAVIRRVAAADLAVIPPPQELDFGTASQLPRMPEAADDPEAREAWARWLRRFHREGAANVEHAPLRDVRPAVLTTLADEVRENAMHPFVLVPDADATPPIVASGLRDALAAAFEASGLGAGALAENLTPLAVMAARALARSTPGTPLDRLLADAADEFVGELGLADEAAAGLHEDLGTLRAALPEGGRVFDLRPDTPLRVYLEVLAAMRAPLERRFAEDLAQLREALIDRLQLDRMSSVGGHSSRALASELGGGVTQLLDTEALAQTLPTDPSWVALDERHRRKLTEALEIIERYLGRANPLPHAVFLRPPGVEFSVPGAPPIEHPVPLAAAVGTFDGVARSMAPLFRAMRLARLEVARSYRPELHDEMLDALDWEAFSTDELSLLPAVTVVTTGRRLRRRAQDSLSQLLRSSRPVHVIVRDDIAAPDEAEDISLYHLDLGHLVMAHREAFAVGSTLARPQLLVERLARMFGEPRPGVVLVPLPRHVSTRWRLIMAEAALWGRACPNFLYDPDAGPSWADRFDVAGNPQPESAWPIHQIRYLEDGSEQTMEAAFTFADAVALQPAYVRHLRVIPRVAWDDDEQLPLADYIAHFDPEHGGRGIPYLWVIDDAGFLQRAVVSRELALACRDRLRGWRVLQELGGFENAERATATAPEAAEAGAAPDRSELEQTYSEAIANARSDGAREAMQRLATRLVYSDAPVAAAAIAGMSAVAPAVPDAVAPSTAEPAAPEVVAEKAEQQPLAIIDPYIDTVLCTSCNDCTDLNPRLFAYDANKQAFIADAGAGSFAELVKAAKLCPAKCIHPGQPRSDDATATPKLIAQAAKFN
ncbi:MAG: ferredoxin [Deltaproteobacteria bacterium]|nr:ferredoxin [Deltaproteobacteria bacterium]